MSGVVFFSVVHESSSSLEQSFSRNLARHCQVDSLSLGLSPEVGIPSGVEV